MVGDFHGHGDIHFLEYLWHGQIDFPGGGERAIQRASFEYALLDLRIRERWVGLGLWGKC
jgi:hypothetical protein